jgi:hypothetical protein
MGASRAFFKRPHPEDLIGWGSSDWYFEVRDDGFVTRQIEAYVNGRILSYDEARREDEHGALTDQPLNASDFSPFRISAHEFEQAWQRAQGGTDRVPAGWLFRVEEISAGVYRATGTGPGGMRVDSTDLDPDKALADCHAFAHRHSDGAG